MKSSEFKIFIFYVSFVILLSVKSTIILDSNDWPQIKYNHNNDVDSTADFLDELFVNDALVTTTPPEKQTMMIETSSEWTNDFENFEDYPLKNSKIKMASTRTTMTTTTSNTTTMTSTLSPTFMSSLTTSALTITSATTTAGTC
ncbi:uncharacterized protein LOC114128966 [Aphis gossypii]|uniref:uncharacterized protein LOC114128966 n=1 Tax=Aphis gossypii TaxID=80765 RepID=UPI002158C33B|nr:uncharacterized protein LOC114128966 [Aphis gossypii]